MWLQENSSLVLGIPSSVVDSEYNYLINPKHADFKRLKIVKREKLNIDKRL